MTAPVFITGIGTGVGKTIASIIVTNALGADYWKPVQTGSEEETDSEFVRSMLLSKSSIVHPETYKFKLPASPHLAAKEEKQAIELDKIISHYNQLSGISAGLVVEGAGGLLVPLNEHEFMIDIISRINAKVILVSRNYLGSINHSLLTAFLCRQRGLDVIGWIFNDDYMQYQEDVARWSGYPVIGQIPALPVINAETLGQQSVLLKEKLTKMLE